MVLEFQGAVVFALWMRPTLTDMVSSCQEGVEGIAALTLTLTDIVLPCQGGAEGTARPPPATSAPVPDSPRTEVIPPPAASADAAALPPRSPRGRGSRRGKPPLPEPPNAAPPVLPLPAPIEQPPTVAPPAPPAATGRQATRRQTAAATAASPSKQRTVEDAGPPDVAGPPQGVTGEAVGAKTENDATVPKPAEEMQGDAGKAPARLRRQPSKAAANDGEGAKEEATLQPVPEGLEAKTAEAETETTQKEAPEGAGPKQAPKRGARGRKTKATVVDEPPAEVPTRTMAAPSDVPVVPAAASEGGKVGAEPGQDTIPPAATVVEPPARRGGVAAMEKGVDEHPPAGKQSRVAWAFQQALAVDLPDEAPPDGPSPAGLGPSEPPIAGPPGDNSPSAVDVETSGVPQAPAVQNPLVRQPSARTVRRARKAATPQPTKLPENPAPSQGDGPAGAARDATAPDQVLLVVKEVVTTTEEVTTEVVVAPAGTGTEGVMTQMETGTEVVLTQAEMATAVPEIETVAPAEDVGRALAPRGGRAKASGRAASRKTASGAAGVSEGPGEEASGMEQAAGASAEDHAVNGGDNVGLPAEGTVRP